MNNVTLIGRLGQDAEQRSTAGGTPVSNFSLATSKKIKGQESTQWHRVICFGNLSEKLTPYLTKGKQIAVTGEIQYRNYENKHGQKVYVTEIIANQIELLGSKGDQPNEGNYDREAAESNEEDIPF